VVSRRREYPKMHVQASESPVAAPR
jgi:hypothetical protein